MDYKNLDEILKKEVSTVGIDIPLLSLNILSSTVFLWKKWEVYVDFLETHPYRLDGDIPIIFVRLGFFEISLYSKKLYKFLYKKKYREELDI